MNGLRAAGVPADDPRARSAALRAARWRAVSQSLSVAIFVLAGLVLVGHTAAAALPFVGAGTLSTPAAWLLLFESLSLWLLDAYNGAIRRYGRWCAAGTLAATLLTLRFLAGQNAPEAAARIQSGGMPALAPQMGLALGCLALAILAIDWRVRERRSPAEPLALGAATIGLVAALGYLYGVPAFYQVGARSPVLIHEAIAVLLLAVAVLAARPESGLLRLTLSDGPGGSLARGAPLVGVAVAVAWGWVALKGRDLGWYGEATGVALSVLATGLTLSLVAWWAAHVLDRTDARRWTLELTLRWQARQAGAVAELSTHAVAGADSASLREEAVRLVADALHASLVEFLEPDSEGDSLVVRAARGSAGDRAVMRDLSSSAGRVLAGGLPAVVDMSEGHSGPEAQWLQAHGLTGAAFVPVSGAARRWGVLAAYVPWPRHITEEDLRLLSTVAGVLGKASDRAAADQVLRLSEQKFAGLFRSSPDAMVVVSLPDGRLQEVNDGFVQMTGYSVEECAGVELNRLGPWNNAPVLLRTIEEESAVRNLESPLITKSGETRVVLCSTETAALAGRPSLLLVMRDISERKRVQSAIQEANDRLSRWVNELEDRGREISLLSEMGDLLQSCTTPDEAGRVTVKMAQQLLPGSSGALCLFTKGGGLLEAVATWGGLTAGEGDFAPHECWALRRGRAHAVSDLESGLLCSHVRQPEARTYLCVPMVAQSEAVGVLHVRRAEEARPSETNTAWLSEPRQRLVVAMADHTALALANLRLRDTLRSQSIRDPLTGLHNRRYLEETLERELLRARRAEWPVGLLMLDLDKFKAVNDTFGHDAGDEVLKGVAHVLQTRLRGTDLVCRYGGEEFVIVLPQLSLAGTLERGDDIRRMVKGLTLSHRTRSLGRLSVSIGAAAFPDHGGTLGDLLEAADAALYRAKAKGGDAVEVAAATEGMPSLPFSDLPPSSRDRRS